MLIRALAAGLLGVLPLCAQTSPSPEAARIDRVAQHFHTADGFSGSVTLARDGHIVFSKGYGEADRNRHLPFTATTRTDIGSVTKQFTAAAILLLQQDGKLHTADTLGSHLSAIPNAIPDAWKPITLRQLLSHTSGIPDYFGRTSGSLRYEAHPPSDLLALVSKLPLAFAPGSDYLYSNTNYLLLALVLQQVSGQPYCEFLSDRILRPLSLKDTTCVSGPSPLVGRAIGYTEDNNSATIPAPSAALSNLLGAGNLVSDAADLVRWTEAVHGGRILTPISLREMTSAVRNNYGYGLRLDTIQGHPNIDHNGIVDGFYSDLDYFPDSHSTVVVLSNVLTFGKTFRSPGSFALTSELMTLAVDPGAILPSEGKEIAVPTPTLDTYVGHYTAAAPGNPTGFRVSRQAQHLIVQLDQPGHSPSELRAESPTDFYFADAEAEIQFDPSGTGHAVIFNYLDETATLFNKTVPPAPPISSACR